MVWLQASFVAVVIHVSLLLTRMPRSQCLSETEKGIGTPLIESNASGGTEIISQQHISQHVGKVSNHDTMSLARQCLLDEGITITSNSLDELVPPVKR